MAKEENTNDYDLDLGLYAYAKSNCGCCHPGGGAMEYDRYGNRYDEFLADGGVPDDLDGDYYYYDSGQGAVVQAPWDTAGVLEIDCLLCHMQGYSTASRAVEVKTGHLYTAPFAGAGMGTVVDNQTVNYDAALVTNGITLNTSPHDFNCAQCHAMDENGYATNPQNARSDIKKRGFTWGDIQGVPAAYERDVHDMAGMSCIDCHSGEIDHQFAKGHDKVGTVRDDLDWTITSCTDCHVDDVNDGDQIGVDPKTAHDGGGFGGIYSFHMDKLDCTVCHIPFKISPTLRTVEIAAGVGSGKYGIWTGGSPGAPSGWTGFSPTYSWWDMEDGSYKLFPMNHMTCVYWGEKDGATGELTHPLFLRNVVAAAAGATLSDDTGDGKAEVNTAAEIDSMITQLLALGEPNIVDPHIWVAPHLFSMSHNVRPAGDALGAGSSCTDCHDTGTWIFDGNYMIWHYAMENHAKLASHLEIIHSDGTHEVLDIDFSDPANNYMENWKLMGYTQAEHDLLVVPR